MNKNLVQKMSVLFFMIACFSVVWTDALQAQQGSKLDLKTKVEKEVKVQKNGKWVTEMVPVEKTGSGDVLVYTITYRNTGTSSVVDAVIVNPIPRELILIQDTAEGSDSDITYSIDNSRTWHKPPIMVEMKKTGGTIESKPAAMDRYTHIRWIIKKPVMPGQSGRVTFKATVT